MTQKYWSLSSVEDLYQDFQKFDLDEDPNIFNKIHEKVARKFKNVAIDKIVHRFFGEKPKMCNIQLLIIIMEQKYLKTARTYKKKIKKKNILFQEIA